MKGEKLIGHAETAF